MTDTRNVVRTHILALALLALIAGCGDGTLVVQYGVGADGEPITAPTTAPGGAPAGTPISTPPGPTSDGTPTVDAPPPILANATFGVRCVAGSGAEFLLLSDAPSDCASDARRLDSFTTAGTLPGAVALELDGSPRFQRVAQYCPAAGPCEGVTFDVSLDMAGNGSWSAIIGGVQRTATFSATSCDYDAAVDPLPGDTPATGLSVDEVAFYQGVKVPVVQDGAMVANLNAPLVAGRPGVVRVFLDTEPDWQERDVVVRLTLGDLVKEQTFRPMVSSTEMSGDSTANFDIAPEELAADADFSVEVLEAQACVVVGGEVARPRVPATGSQALGVQGLAQNMRIVLVPIQYDGDGSGRVPNLDATSVERYRQEAFKNYPVPDIDITVRQTVAYSGTLSPNGAGFGEALNFCLSLRANDNTDNEVYYYCVFQPSSTAQQFCGSGCVAGVAPVPGVNDVGARGGIGISFGGDGEGVFVHELGHTLGRPHSPCGGAAGADPNYPYAQGLIGSWGYDIMNGQLFQPDQRADFMGYCEPTWVSDYTYGLIFDRLRNVIGAQQFMVATPPTRWRTAVLEVDGQLRWGPDKTLSRLPSGAPMLANLRDAAGSKLAEPRVYVTPVADIDAVLLTVEDTGQPGQTIEVPGVGQLTL